MKNSSHHSLHGGATCIVLLAPLDVAGMLSCSIFVNERSYHLLSVVELMQIVAKECSLLEMLDMRLATLKLAKLNTQGVENAPYTCMIRQHHSADFMRRGDIWTLLGEGDLDRGGAPRDEVRKLSLTDTLQ